MERGRVPSVARDGERERGRRLFEDHLELIRDVVERVAARARLGREAGEEFGSFVFLRLIENDFGALRRFRGESGLATYLTAVARRALCDFLAHREGRWRPSARARRLGPHAVRLERLLSRDGLTVKEAVSMVMAESRGSLAREELEAMAIGFPCRPRRRCEPLERVLPELGVTGGVEDPLETRERARVARRVEAALNHSLETLGQDERWMLWQRFGSGRAVSEIATDLDRDPQPLYRMIYRALRRLREGLESRGIGRQDVEFLLAGEGGGIDVEYRLAG